MRQRRRRRRPDNARRATSFGFPGADSEGFCVYACVPGIVASRQVCVIFHAKEFEKWVIALIRAVNKRGRVALYKRYSAGLSPFYYMFFIYLLLYT